MKGLTGYRLLNIFVNVFCILIAFVLVFGILTALANPSVLFECFIILGVVLYGWFANKFFLTVIVNKQPFSKKQKDWLQVNAILASIFALLGISNSIYIFYNPHIMDEMLKQMPAQTPPNMVVDIAVFLLVFCVALLSHVIWTYILLRRNKEMIQ